MKERKLFLIFILLLLCSWTAGQFYGKFAVGKASDAAYVSTEGIIYREVWNGEKDYVLESGDYFGRILVKNAGSGEKLNCRYVRVSGKLSFPKKERNPGGFDEAAYLSGKNIYRVLECDMISEKEGFSFSLRALGSKIRQGIMKNADDLMGDNKGFMLGVMTGDTSALDRDMKSFVRLSGISHLFAVSGMHVGYVLMPFQKSVKRKSIGIGLRSVLCILPIAFFAVMTGLSSSVVRATAGTAYGLIAKAVKRKADTLNGIGFGGIICLILYPLAVNDTGFILSFGAVLSAYFIVPIIKKMKKKESKAFDLLSYGLAVNLGLLPVMLYKYGMFSPTGILITVLASPLSAVLCIFGYLAVILYSFSFTGYLSVLISYGLTAVTKLIEKISEGGALIPNVRLPVYAAYIVAAAYLMFAFFYFGKNKKIRVMSSALAALFVFFFVSAEVKKSRPQIIWFDVGQGSSAFIQTEEGKRILIDGGTGYTDVSELLNKAGYHRLDYVIVSHGDEDHSGGIQNVLKNNDVKTLILPDNPRDDNCESLSEYAKESSIKTVKISGPCMLKTGEQSRVSVYYHEDSASLNNSSLVVQLKTNERSVLFPGDTEIKGEKGLTESGIIGECDIVTASHHGSAGATGKTLLEHTKPKLSVISVGEKNFYGHPAKETLDRLEEAGIHILRTDRDGAITVRFSDGYIGAETWLTEKKLIIR